MPGHGEPHPRERCHGTGATTKEGWPRGRPQPGSHSLLAPAALAAPPPKPLGEMWCDAGSRRGRTGYSPRAAGTATASATSLRTPPRACAPHLPSGPLLDLPARPLYSLPDRSGEVGWEWGTARSTRRDRPAGRHSWCATTAQSTCAVGRGGVPAAPGRLAASSGCGARFTGVRTWGGCGRPTGAAAVASVRIDWSLVRWEGGAASVTSAPLEVHAKAQSSALFARCEPTCCSPFASHQLWVVHGSCERGSARGGFVAARRRR